MDIELIRQLKIGVPPDIQMIFSKEIAQFITANRIMPFQEFEVLETLQATPVAKKGAAKIPLQLQQKLPPYSTHGGMKIPHLHYNGQVFILDGAQWDAFSGMMLEKIKAKVNSINKVSFNQLMELSSTIGNI